MGYTDNQQKGGVHKEPARTDCPGESETLAYCEGRVTAERCAQLDRHFAECPTCVEVLAVFAVIEKEQTVGGKAAAPDSRDATREQAFRVLELVERDEEKFR